VRTVTSAPAGQVRVPPGLPNEQPVTARHDRACKPAHNVRTHGTGTKHFRHHIVGDLTLAYESMDLRAEPDLTMTIYAAEPGSPTEDALRLLSTWAASQETNTAGRY
jgi:hypothetical protein